MKHTRENISRFHLYSASSSRSFHPNLTHWTFFATRFFAKSLILKHLLVFCLLVVVSDILWTLSFSSLLFWFSTSCCVSATDGFYVTYFLHSEWSESYEKFFCQCAVELVWLSAGYLIEHVSNILANNLFYSENQQQCVDEALTSFVEL